ncbi:hypothetical protein JCM14469_00570 [Desulfatiferula olefinivorans]
MTSKTVPISVRISHEDAEFLSRLTIGGAGTPSDKLRAIIREQRQRQSTTTDYPGCFQTIQTLMAPVIEAVRQAENEQGIHSELIFRAFDWFPDLIACVMSSLPESPNAPAAADLGELEKNVAERLFRIMESVLQMGTNRWNHCYNPQQMEKRSRPLLDLAALVRQLEDRNNA